MAKTPWLNSTVIAFLQRIITKDFRILELGAGVSTVWFAKRAGYVLSYENNKEWFDSVTEELKKAGLKNCKLIFDPAYPKNGIQDLQGQFNLILIDGRGRVKNTAVTMVHVKPGGYLMLDDSQRGRYNTIRELLSAWGKIELIEPGVARTTTVWKRRDKK